MTGNGERWKLQPAELEDGAGQLIDARQWTRARLPAVDRHRLNDFKLRPASPTTGKNWRKSVMFCPMGLRQCRAPDPQHPGLHTHQPGSARRSMMVNTGRACNSTAHHGVNDLRHNGDLCHTGGACGADGRYLKTPCRSATNKT
jgi:hypothetical protein